GSRWERSFWSLLAAQFQGAFNDNALRNLAIFLLIASATAPRERYATGEIVGAVFSLPFILFSMAGGYLADRYSKRSVTIGTKLFEIGVMVAAVGGLAFQSLNLELVAVFLASTQAALFGPSKYGMLPELLTQERLSWGNGVLEMGTFLAVILGSVAGAMLADLFRGRQAWSGLVFLGLAVVGLLSSLGISKLSAADPAKRFRLNFLSDLLSQGRLIRRDRIL